MIKLFEQFRNGEKLYSSLIDPICLRYGLNHMEFKIIMFLYNNPSYDTASDIVKYKRLTKSHVSNAIKALAERGLINRVNEDNNRKSIHLSLTSEAKAIAVEGRIIQEGFQEITLRGFSDSETQQLISFIDRINNNIKEYK